MQMGHTTRQASCLAADAGRYVEQLTTKKNGRYRTVSFRFWRRNHSSNSGTHRPFQGAQKQKFLYQMGYYFAAFTMADELLERLR